MSCQSARSCMSVTQLYLVNMGASRERLHLLNISLMRFHPNSSTHVPQLGSCLTQKLIMDRDLLRVKRCSVPGRYLKSLRVICIYHNDRDDTGCDSILGRPLQAQVNCTCSFLSGSDLTLLACYHSERRQPRCKAIHHDTHEGYDLHQLRYRSAIELHLMGYEAAALPILLRVTH